MSKLPRKHRSRLHRCVDDVITRSSVIGLSMNLISNGFGIRFGTNHGDRANAMVDFLGTYGSQDEGPAPTFTLRSLADEEQFRALSDVCSEFRDEWAGDSLAVSPNVDVIIHRPINSLQPILWNIFFRRERAVYSVTKSVSDDSNYETFRLVRILFHIAFVEAGFLPIHAATVASANRGVCLMGDKYAGKTTLALRCLDRLGWSFVANDKSYLRMSEGRLKVAALPIRAGIRSGTIDMFPELKRHAGFKAPQAPDRARAETRIYLRPKEIASTFGVDLVESVNAHALVHLVRGPANCISEALWLDEVRSRELLYAQHTPHDAFEEHPYWRDVVNSELSSRETITVASGLEGALRSVPSLKLSYGDDDDGVLRNLEAIVAGNLKKN